MKENVENHIERNEETVLHFLFFRYAPGAFSWLIPLVVIAMIGAFVFNILGQTIIFNNDIIYDIMLYLTAN